MRAYVTLTLFAASGLVLLGACEKKSASVDPPPSPTAEPDATLRFPADGVRYTPLPGWADRRAERAKRFVDPKAAERATKPHEGEIFSLDAPSGSGFVGVSLTKLPIPDGGDPVTMLQTMSDGLRDFYAKGSFPYAVVTPPRPLRTEAGIVGAEMSQRWEIDGRGQRAAERMFVRHGSTYLLECNWADRLGDAPPDLSRILEGLHFDP